MADVILPRQGGADALRGFIGLTLPPLELCLFVNDHQPDENDLPGTYQEPEGGGYGPHLLRPDIWRITEGSPPRADAPEVIFTFNAAVGPVFGWFLRRRSTRRIALAQRFADGPYDVQVVGDRIRVKPAVVWRVG